MNRKARKLIKKPHLFFYDFALKRMGKFKAPAKQFSTTLKENTFSIISAVFNVENYLDKYFESIVSQTAGFGGNIEVIMVDDGSTDKSAKIIKAWQRKYPRNIIYVKKENGGQASARNLGLRHASGQWVTFVDPDDFLDQTYMLEVDKFLSDTKHDDVSILSCNFIFYLEDKKTFSDTHPMKFRFAEGNKVLPIDGMGKHMQLSVNNAFFRRSIIMSCAIEFDETIKPSFEDAHFVGQYLVAARGGKIGFSRSAKYYYRKRADGSSTLDTGWTKPSRFREVQEGQLRLLENARVSLGKVPVDIQRAVLYDFVWLLKRLLNNDQAVAFLGQDQKDYHVDIMRRIFRYIDAAVIMDFELAGVWFYHKVGLLGCFKGAAPSIQIVYVDDFDPQSLQLKLRYFVSGDTTEAFTIDGEDVTPIHAKTRAHDFLGRNFVNERIVWLPIKCGSKLLTAKVGGNEAARFSLSAKQHEKGISLIAIDEHFRNRAKVYPALPPAARALHALARRPAAMRRYDGAWLLMDRESEADDNAEHLYRHIKTHHPEVNAHFILRKEARDWRRLKSEGFQLIDFGSIEHKVALLNCAHLISSHADNYVVEYLPRKIYGNHLKYKTTFLQHGVTKDDMSAWLNTKNLACFVTSAPGEHRSIAGNGNRYKFTEREVVLAGLPRHDALIAPGAEAGKSILVMPTWRNSLVGRASATSGRRDLSPNFMESEYAQRWQVFFNNRELARLRRDYGYEVVFYPHPIMRSCLPHFKIPDWVKVPKPETTSFQRLFRSCAIMVTDYSSVAFDFAYLEKPVVYYHFDAESFFGGGHTFQKGYFDYGRDGFGPVAIQESEAIAHLAHLMERGGRSDDEYLERVKRFFPFRDGKCCERVFEAISNLDKPVQAPQVNVAQLLDYAEKASASENWVLAEDRWRRYMEWAPEAVPDHAVPLLARAKRHLGKYDEAAALLDGCPDSPNSAITTPMLIERAELAAVRRDYATAVECLLPLLPDGNEPADPYVALRLAEFFSQSGEPDLVARALDLCPVDYRDGARYRVEKARCESALGDWETAAGLWMALVREQIAGLPKDALLYLAEAQYRMGDVDLAAQSLATHLKAAPNDLKGLRKAAECALSRENWQDVVKFLSQIQKLAPTTLSIDDVALLAVCQHWIGDLKEAEKNYLTVQVNGGMTVELAGKYAEILYAGKQWRKLVDLADANLIGTDPTVAGPAASQHGLDGKPDFVMVGIACAKLALMDRAEPALCQAVELFPDNSDALIAYAEVLTARKDWALAERCWTRVLDDHRRIAPSHAPLRVVEAMRNRGLLHEVETFLYSEEEMIMREKLEKKSGDPALLREYAMLLERMAKRAAAAKPRNRLKIMPEPNRVVPESRKEREVVQYAKGLATQSTLSG
jgi:glycosyltransferase involved in cell wall biosynthesis/tetratricopeptide (TPR) repeat protein